MFPGMTIPLFVFEERYKRLVRYCLEQEQPRFIMTLSKPTDVIQDGSAAFYPTGTFVHIVDVSENPDGTYNLMGHGQSRCIIDGTKEERVKETDGGERSLFFSDAHEHPLERIDPNLERVAAWDALDIFRDYARMFFTGEASKQIEDVIPDDPVFQASFICANIRVPVHDRQRLLEASSLNQRFSLAQALMEERVAAHKPAESTN